MKELTIKQYMVTLIVSIIGAGGFAFSRGLGKYVGKNGWIVILICALIAFMAICLVNYLVKLSGYKNIAEIARLATGTVFGKIILIEFAFFLLFSGALQIRDYAEVIKINLLAKTPIQLILMVLIILATYLIMGRMEALVKFNEIAVWIMIVPIIVMLTFVIGRGQVTNVLPFFDLDKVDFLGAIKTGLYAFSSFEIIYFMLPRLKKEDRGKTRSAVIKVLGIAVIFYILIYTVVLYYFGVGEGGKLLWPFLAVIKGIQGSASVVQNWDGLILMIYMIFNFAAFVNTYYGAVYIAKKVFNFKELICAFPIISAVFYIIALIPDNTIQNMYYLDNVLPYFYLVNYIIVPIILIIGLKYKFKNLKKAAVALVLIFAMLTTGCYDRIEIDKRAFVSSIGLDVGRDVIKNLSKEEVEKIARTHEMPKKVELTLGFPQITKLEDESGEGNPEFSVTGEAGTFDDAIVKIAAKNSRNVTFGTGKLMIISKEFFDHPDVLEEILENVRRNVIINKSMYVIVSNTDAKEVINFEPAMEKSAEDYLLGLIENSKDNGYLSKVTLNEFLSSMSNGVDMNLPMVDLDLQKKEIRLSGGLIIKNYKSLGRLSDNETKDVGILSNKLKDAKKVVTFDGELVDFNITQIKRKIKTTYEGGKLKIDFKVRLEGGLQGYSGTAGGEVDNDIIGKIEKRYDEVLEDEFLSLVNYLHVKKNVDILGAREEIIAYHPFIWKDIEDSWSDKLKEAEVTVNVKTKIRRVGATD